MVRQVQVTCAQEGWEREGRASKLAIGDSLARPPLAVPSERPWHPKEQVCTRAGSGGRWPRLAGAGDEGRPPDRNAHPPGEEGCLISLPSPRPEISHLPWAHHLHSQFLTALICMCMCWGAEASIR